MPIYSAHKKIPEPFRKRNHFHLPLNLKAANGFASYSAPSVDATKTAFTVTGKNQPGETLTINFTDYKPSQELALNDYIFIQFVDGGFDTETRYSITVSSPSCQVFVMPAGDCIVLQLNSPLYIAPNPSAWTLGLTIAGLPNPRYVR
jgi:hypothetical protein